MGTEKGNGGVETNSGGDTTIGGSVAGRDVRQETIHNEGGPVARYAVVGTVIVAVVAIVALALTRIAAVPTPPVTAAAVGSASTPAEPAASDIAVPTAPPVLSAGAAAGQPTVTVPTPSLSSGPSATTSAAATADTTAPAVAATTPSGTSGGSQEIITFLATSSKTGRGVLSMNGDGSGQTILVDLSQDNGLNSFAWAPDHTRLLLFASGSNRQSLFPDSNEIFVTAPNGARLINLTNNPAYDYSANWSPDGSRIAFVSDRDSGNSEYSFNSEIYLMNADGTGVARLTTMDPDLVRADNRANYDPHWSPDGHRIAFVSRRDGNEEIYVMNADGSGQTNLTNNTAWDTSPVWSPDGRQLLFVSTRDQTTGGIAQIWVMNSDGSGPTELTTVSNNSSANWSPDGKKIAFVSEQDGNSEIYVMNPDGSEQTRLTRSVDTDNQPAWSPDSRRIAYVSGRDGLPQIYVVGSDGSGITRLTTSFDFLWQPVWQSRP